MAQTTIINYNYSNEKTQKEILCKTNILKFFPLP